MSFSHFLKFLLQILILLSLSVADMFGQSWEKIKTIVLDFEPHQMSVDRKSQLFICDINGNIYKYNARMEQLNLYSTKKIGNIYLLEARHGLRVFAFYQDLQQYLLTDRFLANERSAAFDPNIFIRLATLSQDLNIWTIDENDLTIRKIRSSDGYQLIENQWASQYSNETLNISFIKEYKNRLYLLDKGKRVYVFDNLGNLITRLDTPDALSIVFHGDKLIVKYPKKIGIHQLLNLEEEILNLPIEADQLQILEDSFYLFEGRKIHVYQLNDH